VLQIDPRIRGVAEAEKSLQRGDTVAAAGSVIRMMPHIGQLDGKKSPLVARAQRVLAVALARNDGVLALEREVPRYARGHWADTGVEARSHRLDWAIGALRRELYGKKDDPGLLSDLAEALARVDAHRGEARDILERLANKDLVATPSAYAVLAGLRAKSGDLHGEQLALERCRAMSREAALCSERAHG